MNSEVNSRTITVGDADVHLLEAGGGPRAVLLLHGRSFQARTWKELGTLSHLADHGLFAVAVDVPGFGESPPADVEPETFLAALLDALELERPVVVAPSMAGAFALPLAVNEPERLAGFVPIAPAGLDQWQPELGRATVQTLVLWGAEDRLLPPALADRMVAAMPHAEKAVLEGARHPCYLDRPEEFHGLLVELAERVLGR